MAVAEDDGTQRMKLDRMQQQLHTRHLEAAGPLQMRSRPRVARPAGSMPLPRQ